MANKHNPTAIALFHVVFAAATSIDYNQQWESKGNYFDFAIHGENAPLLNTGELFRSEDKAGRKMLFLGTELGNVVLWTAKQSGKKVVVWQSSSTMFDYVKQSFGNTTSEVSPELFQYLIGDTVTDTVAARFQKEDQSKREVLIAVHNGISDMLNAPDTVAEKIVEVAQVVEVVEVVKNKEVEQAEAPKTAKPEVNQSTQKEEPKMNTTPKAAVKQPTQFTSWGVFWRVSGLAVVIIAAIVAIAFGLHFGAAYIAGLGLSETVALALRYLLHFVSTVAMYLSLAKGWECITSVFAKREPVISAATPAPAAA